MMSDSKISIIIMHDLIPIFSTPKNNIANNNPKTPIITPRTAKKKFLSL